MKAKRFGNPVPVEICCKKIVGHEVTRLSDDESDYVCQEEFGRFWEHGLDRLNYAARRRLATAFRPRQAYSMLQLTGHTKLTYL